MKKTFSLLLVLVTLLNLATLSSFAQPTDQDPITPSICEDDMAIEKEDFELEQAEWIPSPIPAISPIEDRMEILENGEEFVQKIAVETLAVNGSLEETSGEILTVNEAVEKYAIDRFTLTELAHQKGILTASQRIESYCNLLEQRRFENLCCLNRPVTMLVNYGASNDITAEETQRIQSVLASLGAFTSGEETALSPAAIADPASDSLEEIDENDLCYTSTNFSVYYSVTGGITLTSVIEAANYLEEIRNLFVDQLGFRSPLLETGQTTYRVRLLSSSDHAVLNKNGLTVTVNEQALTSASHIIIYNFTSISDTVTKESIAHEYFHAIQKAYNTSVSNIWFEEATANWASIYKSGTSISCNAAIQAYLNSTDPIYRDDAQGYGAVLFPLTIQSMCGINGIKSIYQTYGEQTTTNLSFADFKTDVVDEALSPYHQSFDKIFLRMARYNYAPQHWYKLYHPGGADAISSWTPRITQLTTTVSSSRDQSYKSVISGATVGPYSSNYYKLIPDVSGQTSQLKVTVTVSGTGAQVNYSYQNASGTYSMGAMTNSATNTYTYTTENYGSMSSFCVIVSSTNMNSENISYSITYHVERGTSESVTIPATNRYWERVLTLGAGEYKDYILTFASGGPQLIQTFGSKDTYFFLYDSEGNRLNTSPTGDDAGYSNNALLSYSFTANTEYRLRVAFYNSLVTGDIRLSIIPTVTYANYEAIPAHTNTNVVSATLSGNCSNLYTYKFTTQTDYAVNVASNGDVYLYIINPNSAEPIVSANNSTPSSTKGEESLYNDDYQNTSQSQITKTFKANTTYLVIVAAYNPTTGSGTQYYLSFS